MNTKPAFKDGEVIELDTDGCIIQWDGDKGEPYNCGETPEEFGLHNLWEHEIGRIGVSITDWQRAQKP